MTDLYVQRGDRLAARKVAGEIVILSAEDSILFVLNEVGSSIWEAADGLTPLTVIVKDSICVEYDIDADSALRDALEFVTTLEEHGLVRTSKAPWLGAVDILSDPGGPYG
jgi:Coenzyme PQQ synthesis protein D (PqqD)